MNTNRNLEAEFIHNLVHYLSLNLTLTLTLTLTTRQWQLVDTGIIPYDAQPNSAVVEVFKAGDMMPPAITHHDIEVRERRSRSNEFEIQKSPQIFLLNIEI